ncbi:MAG: DUF6455 family protein [Bacteroidota bacterium]|nr:DUF6455 family protein [Kiloniellaceae bacterium]
MFIFLSRLDVHSRLMGRMMTRCGIDPAHLAQDRLGLTFAAAARSCMACAHTEACQRWADAAEADGRVAEPPAFCPNAERFRDARAQAH